MPLATRQAENTCLYSRSVTQFPIFSFIPSSSIIFLDQLECRRATFEQVLSAGKKKQKMSTVEPDQLASVIASCACFVRATLLEHFKITYLNTLIILMMRGHMQRRSRFYTSTFLRFLFVKFLGDFAT